MSDGKGRRPLTSKERKSLKNSVKMPQSRQKSIIRKKQSRIRELKNPPIRKRNSRKKLQKVKLRRLFSSKKKSRNHKDKSKI